MMNGFDLQHTSIPVQEIKSGNAQRDGIPAIDQPIFSSISEYSFFPDDIRILGLHLNGLAKAYPIPILIWHEVVNDHIGELPISITYCPWCGSGIAFDAQVDQSTRTFGVSGLLYKSDTLLYDRETESLWSQMKMESIAGTSMGKALHMLPLAHTTLGEWKKSYPESLILTTRTGYVRNYEHSPYSDYDNSDQLYFPVLPSNDAYPLKEWVLGIEVNNKFKAYPFSALLEHDETLLTDIFEGQTFNIRYDVLHDVATITDQAGNTYPSVTAYWFAWYAFHPNSEVFQKDNNAN
ncbi:MAG: DUF3179 domain-containing protein [Saprospiraceae bacterium]|nr:DUF3179 domain-containing protein [Saprospiraceae bacterium]